MCVRDPTFVRAYVHARPYMRAISYSIDPLRARPYVCARPYMHTCVRACVQDPNCVQDPTLLIHVICAALLIHGPQLYSTLLIHDPLLHSSLLY